MKKITTIILLLTTICVSALNAAEPAQSSSSANSANKTLKIKKFYIGMPVSEAYKVWRELGFTTALYGEKDGSEKMTRFDFNDKALRKMFSISKDMRIQDFIKNLQKAYGLSFELTFDHNKDLFGMEHNITKYTYISDEGLLIEIISDKNSLPEDELGFFSGETWSLKMEKVRSKKEVMQNYD